MPCCCETNLKAAFVLGIISLILSCGNFPFKLYAEGAIGIAVSIVLIVGAKAPNATALLVWMVLACLECAAFIIMAILLIVAGTAIAVANPEDLKSSLIDSGIASEHDLHGLSQEDVKTALGAMAIAGVVYLVGFIMFQIWTIIVANKARKEIDQGIKI